jgi:hypothetical protein
MRDLLIALFFILIVLSPAFVGLNASRQTDSDPGSET